MTPQQKLEKRMDMERRLVRHLIRTMKAHGWNIRYIDDGGDEDIIPKTEEEAMDAVFAVDEARIYFKKEIGGKEVTHGAYIVLGNDGFDAIADYSYSENEGDDFKTVMETEMDPYTDKLEEEAMTWR